MGGARQGDFGRDVPRFLVFKVLQALFLGVSGHAFAAYFFQLDQSGQLRFGHTAVREEDKAVGVGDGQYFCTQLDGFFGCVLRHVAGAGNQYAFAFDAVVAGFQHGLGKIHAAVAGGFRANQAAAPFEAFAGQDGSKFVADFFVLAEQIADFAAAYADVTGRDVGVGADVAVEFGHKGLAEAHYFGIGFAFRVKVRTAFAAAHRQGGQRIFEHLFKGEEFQHAQIDCRVETQTAFVRADGRAHLNTVAAVDLNLAFVVHPSDAEHNHTFRFNNTLKQALLGVFRVFRQKRIQTHEYFFNSLVEGFLVGVALFKIGKQGVQVSHFFNSY